MDDLNLSRRLLALGVAYASMALGLLTAGAEVAPQLHIAFDASSCIFAGFAASQLMAMSQHMSRRLEALMGMTFYAAFATELFHLMVGVEWNKISILTQHSISSLRPLTWPPTAIVPALGLLAALALFRNTRPMGARWFASGLVFLLLITLAVFFQIPPYTVPGWLGISRPSLIGAPLLWMIIGLVCWRARRMDRLMGVFGASTTLFIAAYVFMLYSTAPHDLLAMLAHLGKVLGYFFLVLMLSRIDSLDARRVVEAERRLRERTAELQAINQELEAFSYSVSHDLRAPLRAIDGFSQILLEDYSSQLDEQGRSYLKRVRDATQRMGQLIDDMLTLSRITRAEMRRETVNLSTIANDVLEEFQKDQPERKVDWYVEPKLVVEGDAPLLRVVLTNLLGNAWKYTGKTTIAKIEFGTVHNADGTKDFFVRDNGAGFDMAYAGKLFGAFQRLHTFAEFPGTGIGLATAQRIIHRHGGKVRGEGAPNQGATFYFSLPAKPKYGGVS